uniref:NIDO domain-containing protein n=1 Tax=Leptobrachium leishanense TaxID=445787 RepID=A0A8C5QAY2_9ANUR
MLLVLLFLLVAVFVAVHLVSSESFLYPFGTSVGDKITPVEDDGTSGEVHLSAVFKFFSKEYNSLYVNNNGVISFKSATFVTPFWGDVDIELGGRVCYRECTDPGLLQMITNDMESHLPEQHFTATWAFIATWDKVAYYGSASTRVNTFQAVLTSDGYRYYIILNYEDVQWTTGTASDGDPETGLGGIPAQAGFNSGDSSHYFNIPGSRTPEILKIKSTSNVDFPGKWIFRVDNFEVPGGSYFAKEGEEFWKDDGCSTKCLCKSNGDIPCVSESCPPSATCEASGSFFKCQEIQEKEKTCF